MPDVSVVVPFFNPGANIDDCLASLAAQTLTPDRYEVVLVDDGSTDGSDRRVQRYVEAMPDRFQLIRIPASGWPGRPRNVGVDAARGTYIQFVDSDDSLAPEALQRLLDEAQASDADIVVGKLTSDFRGLNHHVFRHTVVGRTLFDYPLVDTLTPHKMVRRRLLTEHGIRFAEGPRHVEDEHFSMQIYTRASSVAVVGDLACYFYRRRRVSGRNLGDTEVVAADYFRDLAAVLDVIDQQVDDPAARVPLQRRFYRGELLGRLRGRAMQRYSQTYRREVLDGVRRLATTRFAPAVRDGLALFLRVQSRLMLDDDIAGLTSYGAWLDDVGLAASVSAPTWREGHLTLTLSATLQLGTGPLVLDRDGADWLLPSAAAPGVGRADRLVTDNDLADADLDCATVSRGDSQLWSRTEGLSLRVTDEGHVEIDGTVVLDPTTLQGGRPLEPGLWDLRLRVGFGGLTFGSPLRPASAPLAPDACLVLADGQPRAVQPFWTSPSPTLALDVDEWSHPLAELLDDQAPAVERRRLTLPVPRLATSPSPMTLPAELALMGARGAPVRLPATLEVTTDGAALRAELPRRLPGDDLQPWVQVGRPPYRRLDWRLVKRGRRRMFIRRSPASTS